MKRGDFRTSSAFSRQWVLQADSRLVVCPNPAASIGLGRHGDNVIRGLLEPEQPRVAVRELVVRTPLWHLDSGRVPGVRFGRAFLAQPEKHGVGLLMNAAQAGFVARKAESWSGTRQRLPENRVHGQLRYGAFVKRPPAFLACFYETIAATPSRFRGWTMGGSTCLSIILNGGGGTDDRFVSSVTQGLRPAKFHENLRRQEAVNLRSIFAFPSSLVFKRLRCFFDPVIPR